MAYSGNNGGTFNLGSTSSSPFTLLGGTYTVTVTSAAWGGGNVDLQVLGPDGATYVSVLTTKFTANSTQNLRLPAGTYKIIVTTATGAYASVAASDPRSRFD